MSTGQRKVDIFLKKFLPQQQITENFFDYLQSLIEQSNASIFRSQGVFTPNIATTNVLSSSAADTVDFYSPLTGVDGLGRILELDPLQGADVPFENAVGVEYHTGLRYQMVPRETETNVRTGKIKYTFLEEAIGELAEPSLVADDGDGTLTIRVDSVCEAGVKNAGRKVRVWLKEAVSGAQAFEELTVQWGGGFNYIETTHALGQQIGAISTDATKYQVHLIGPTIKRNTDLSLDSNVIYTGKVTGAGAGVMPTVFNHNDVSNLAYGISQLSDLFFEEHDTGDGTHTDVTAETITTKQAIEGVQLDTRVNAGDEDTPDVAVSHTLFPSVGGTGIQSVKWRLRDSSGATVAFIDAHGNAYFQNLAAVSSIFKSNLVVEGNSTFGDDIDADVTTFKSKLASLSDLLLILDSDNDSIGNMFRLFKHSAVDGNEVFRVEEDGDLKLFGNLYSANPGLNIDLDSDNNDTGELLQITKNGGLVTLLQLLEDGELKLSNNIITDLVSLAIDLDTSSVVVGVQAFARYVVSGLVSPGETFIITYDPAGVPHAETITFVLGAPANGNQVSLNIGDALQNTVDAINALFTAAELVALKENATTIKITVGSNFIGLASTGKVKLEETCPNIAVTDADGAGLVQGGADGAASGGTFSITKKNGLFTLLQVLEEGELKLFNSIITDEAEMTLDLDAANAKINEMFTFTKNGGATNLWRILASGAMQMFGNILTNNPTLAIDLDNDNNDGGETFSITKNAGAVILWTLSENGDAKALRDVLSGTATAYANKLGVAINANGSLNETHDETLFRKLLRATPKNPSSKIIDIASSRITAYDSSDYVLPMGTAVSVFTGGSVNFGTGVVTGGANFVPISFVGQAGKWAKYSVNLLKDNTLLVLPAVGFGNTKALAPNPPLKGGAISVVVVAVQDDGSAGSGTILDVTEANLDRLPSAGGGGGSGVAETPLRWIEGASTAVPDFDDGMLSYTFEPGLGQVLSAVIKVPEDYEDGSPITAYGQFYSAGVADDVKMKAIATLIRLGIDQKNSVANQHTSTNGVVTLAAGTVDEPQKLTLDLTNVDGEINGIAVAPGDIIKIQFTREAGAPDTSAANAKTLADAWGVKFA